MYVFMYVCTGGWNIADCVSRSYDLEGMMIMTVMTNVPCLYE